MQVNKQNTRVSCIKVQELLIKTLKFVNYVGCSFLNNNFVDFCISAFLFKISTPCRSNNFFFFFWWKNFKHACVVSWNKLFWNKLIKRTIKMDSTGILSLYFSENKCILTVRFLCFKFIAIRLLGKSHDIEF